MLEYFCLKPFAHIIRVSRNLEAKWSHIQNSLCYFCAWISSLFKWSNSISGLFNKFKSWTIFHKGDFSTSEGIHLKIELPATKNVIVVYRLVLCCHGEPPSDVACKDLSLVTLCSDTFLISLLYILFLVSWCLSDGERLGQPGEAGSGRSDRQIGRWQQVFKTLLIKHLRHCRIGMSRETGGIGKKQRLLLVGRRGFLQFWFVI